MVENLFFVLYYMGKGGCADEEDSVIFGFGLDIGGVRGGAEPERDG
jgi:hypothetical protein